MRLSILTVVCLLASIAISSVSMADPIVKVENGYVDWCQGFTNERDAAKCNLGEFAFDYEGNLITDIDGPAPDDDA